MITDIYSKRQRRQRGQMPDVFQCEYLPIELKTQISMLIQETLGSSDSSIGFVAHQVYANILATLAKEWARPDLELDRFDRYPEQKLIQALVNEGSIDRSLDIIELAFNWANGQAENPEYFPGNMDGRAHVDSCIEELNARFKEHGVGFAFINDEIIRVDSDVLHNEVVKPAIHFLSVPGFEGPQEEFFAAHDHYRHGFYKEALNEANKAFESTMKVICDQKGWEYKGDTAKKLITVCMDNGLFPSYYQSHLSALANLLEGGVPAIRNNEGGHGQGGAIKTVDPHIVSYTLHMTAAAIVLLANSANSLS